MTDYYRRLITFFLVIVFCIYACDQVDKAYQRLIKVEDWQQRHTPKKAKPQVWTKATKSAGLNYRIKTLIKRYSGQYGLPESLVYAVIEYESMRAVGYNLEKAVTVRSRSGAVGLMQIMPIHAKFRGLPVTALENPEINIKIGCAYLAHMLHIAKSRGYNNELAEALRMYNQGPGRGNGIVHRSRYKNWDNYVYKIIAQSNSDMICIN